jgi:PAS domain S-box-containing protein
MADYSQKTKEELINELQKLEEGYRLLEKENKYRILESDEKFKIIFESANCGKSITLITGEIHVNKAFCDLLGYTAEELQNKKWQDITYTDDIEVTQKEVEKLLGGAIKETRFNKRYLHKNGSVIWADVSVAIQYDAVQNPQYFITTIIDITTRKLAEDALQMSEANFRNLAENTNGGILIALATGRIIYASPQACLLLGYTVEEALELSQVDLLNAEDYPRMKQRLQNRIAGLYEPPVYEGLLKRKDGTSFDAEIYASRTYWQNQTCNMVLFHDITARKQLEAALIASTEFTKNLINTMQDGFSVLDINGVHTDVNASLCQLTGFSSEELIGTGMPHKYWPPEEYGQIETGFQEMTTGGVQNLELLFMNKNGTRFPVIVSPSELKDPNGNTIGYSATVKDITNLKLAQKELLLSEAKFRRTFDQSPVASAMVDLDKKFIKCNEAFCNFIGYTENELIGNSISFITYPEDAQVGMDQLKQLALGQLDLVRFQKRYLKKDGTVLFGDISISLIHDKENKPLYFLPIIQDVSERVVAEKAIRDAEANARAIMEATPDTLILLDENGFVIDTNEAHAIRFGLKREDLISKCIYTILPDDVAAYRKRLIRQVVETQKPVFGEDIRNNRITEYSIFPVVSDNKNRRVAVFAKDITDRRNTELNVKQNEERLKSLVRIFQFNAENTQALLDFTLEEAILLTGSKIGYIYFYDEQAELFTLFSWSKQVMEQCLIKEPRTQYDLRDTGIWGEAVRQRKPIMLNNFQVPHPLQKGYPEGHAPLSKFLTIPVLIENKIEAVVGVGNKDTDYNETDVLHLTLLMDSTWKVVRKMQIDELLKNQNEELQQLNAQKDKFFSIIAHDLRGPFNGFLGLSEIMVKDLPSLTMPEIQRIAVTLNNSATNLFRLLENLLSWSTIKQGIISYNPKPLKLHQILADCIELNQESAINKRIEIQIAFLDEFIVFADTDLLQTIVRNLVSNAVKFTPKGGKVEVLAKPFSNQYVQISVKDSGIGMNREICDNLFNLGYKTNRRGTDGESSTGLGLLLCKEFIEKHNGKLWVESEEGKGSTFHFTIPFDESHVQKIGNIDLTHSSRTPDSLNLKILIAEDDEVSDSLLTIDVQKISRKIIKATTGVATVEYCRQNPDLDLILMDIQMPELGGYEATRQIREFNKNVVIIAQTAYGLSGDREKAIEAGCNDYISKPINKAELLAMISKHCLK